MSMQLFWQSSQTLAQIGKGSAPDLISTLGLMAEAASPTGLESSGVKLKTKAYTYWEKRITKHRRDRDGLSSELDPVLEYETKLKDRCIGKPESYEERKAGREAEIKGLKEALKLLSTEASFYHGTIVPSAALPV